jgi:SAM-dependent methyltransferase
VQHFESAAAGYTAFRNGWPLSVIRRQERDSLAALMPVEAGDLVLDAGCGDGELLRWLLGLGARPVGIDVSRGMAIQCRRQGFLVSVQDLEAPAFQPAFDWVLCFGALEFARDPARALAAMAQSLRPGGRLVLLFPRLCALGRLYAAYHRFAHGMRIHLFRHRDIALSMRAAGLNEPAVWRDLSLSTLCVADSGARRE